MIAERKSNIPTHRNEFLPFTMNNLWDNKGSKKKAVRIGRGVGSGKGVTAGRGYNGYNSRSGGGVHPRFEGGQSSIVRRLPKMGMSIRNKQRPIYINMSTILYYINMGRLNPQEPITMKALHTAGAFGTAKFGVKILGRGVEKINQPLKLEVTDASKSVIDAVKQNGGSVTCFYKTRLLMREAIHPEKFPFKLRDPIPSARWVRQMERIRNRGAEVVYKMPQWMKEDFEKEKEEEQEDAKAKEEGFNIPISREPGCGKDKIRKRKPVIWKTLNYGL